MAHDTAAAAPTGAVPTAGSRRCALSLTAVPGRLIGLDLARGVAILGMFAAHLGPDPSVGGPLGWLMEVARGRSSALFALLAGFTLVLLTGRPEPRTGRAGRQAVGRVLIRAAVLIGLGYVLAALDTSVDVILAAYGMIFVLALPLYRLRASALAAVAAAAALVLPQVLYLLRTAVDGGSWADTAIAVDPLARVTGSDGVLELFVTGAYPVLTWLPFIIAGMAVAKVDLTRPCAPVGVALCGGALAVLGYGGSWLALHLVPGAQSAVSAATDGGQAASAWWSDAVGDPSSPTPSWLLVAAPHSQTTWSVLGNTGVALVVLAVCLVATERSARLRWIAAPVIAVGSMSLTAYVAHILAISAFDTDDLPASAGLPVFFGFCAAAVFLALAWTRFFRRGPLEYAMRTVTAPARLLR
ncbi:DUF418 domain-containing protein [Streptomyces sp. NPDC059176]|uniref:DUF418 domain-containing protein n=1 Tax=unclassified Streptomyces TaxID=2593676 RepID=UPI00367C6086